MFSFVLRVADIGKFSVLMKNLKVPGSSGHQRKLLSLFLFGGRKNIVFL